MLPSTVDAPYGEVAVAMVIFSGAELLMAWDQEEAEVALLEFQVWGGLAYHSRLPTQSLYLPVSCILSFSRMMA